MEDKKDHLKMQAEELDKWGSEIDELKARADNTKSESKWKLSNQGSELHQKIERARDKLIQVFISIRNQDHSG